MVGSEDIAGCGDVPECAISYGFRQEYELSKKVLEIAFYPGSVFDTQDMRRYASRIEVNVISRSGPQITSPGQKIVCLIGLVRLDFHLIERKVNESGPLVVRIKIDHDNDQVILIRRTLAETEQHVVIDWMELDIPVVLESLVLFANAIHQADHFAQAIGTIQIPFANLVFL